MPTQAAACGELEISEEPCGPIRLDVPAGGAKGCENIGGETMRTILSGLGAAAVLVAASSAQAVNVQITPKPAVERARRRRQGAPVRARTMAGQPRRQRRRIVGHRVDAGRQQLQRRGIARQRRLDLRKQRALDRADGAAASEHQLQRAGPAGQQGRQAQRLAVVHPHGDVGGRQRRTHRAGHVVRLCQVGPSERQQGTAGL